MKKLLVLLALVIAAGFTGCEDTNKQPAGKDTYATVITFNVNGGTGSMSKQQIPENTSANLKANTFTRDNYTFAGWATTAAATTAEYTDGQSYTAVAGNQTVTLYALWTQILAGSSVVSFDNAGGSGGQTANVTATPDQPMPALSVAAPTYEGNTGVYAADYYNTFTCGSTSNANALNALYNVSYPSDTENFFEKKWFNGYWDAQTGGKKYYNADLSSAANWDKTGTTATLYAQWLTAAQKYPSMPTGENDFIAYYVETPPAIDGDANDPAWAKARWQPIKYQWMYSSTNITQASNAADFSGRFKVVWTGGTADTSRLYILTEIIDDTISVTRNADFGTGYTDAHNDDCLEFFIDENASGARRHASGQGNNFFTYHMGYRDNNHFAADYIGSDGGGGTGYSTNNSTDLALRIQNSIILRNVHLNYKIIKRGPTPGTSPLVNTTDTWITEMKVYDSTYPVNSTPGMPSSAGPSDGSNPGAPTNPQLDPVVLTEGKTMGLVVAYCDSDTSSTRNHFFGSMRVSGTSDNARNTAYQDCTGYAKIYLVK
jgi:uncharacterized repeat protein (TIGR02543 family)